MFRNLSLAENCPSWFILFVFSMLLASFARKVSATGNSGQIEKINFVLNL
jgi:hypothetical protein